MDIKMVDVTVHVDEGLDKQGWATMINRLHDEDGILSVGHVDHQPHLMVVEYNPDYLSSSNVLGMVQQGGLHAELIGL